MKKPKSILFLLVSLVLLGCDLVEDRGPFRWTMVNVNNNPQGDAHLIQTPDGKTVLIDTGYPSLAVADLVPYLASVNLTAIDTVIITHPHSDHYGGLVPLLDHGIRIGEVYFNRPTEARCQSEPWGCSYADIVAIEERLKAASIPLKTVEPGKTFDFAGNTRIEVLYAFNLDNSPVGQIDINDESLIILVQHQGHRFLFAGDLNQAIG